MTLDHAELLAITESSLRSTSALCSLAGQTMTACESRPVIVIVAASPDEQKIMERRAAELGSTGDAEARANLLTLAARENAQRFTGLLRMMGVEARLADPLALAPITRGSPLEAEPRVLHARRWEDAAHAARAVVLAGGVGRSTDGRITSLGTGGAALSGLFVAQRLGLPARLIVAASDEEPTETFELPRRAALFARRHALTYEASTRIALAPNAQPAAV
jgi:aspartokinase